MDPPSSLVEYIYCRWANRPRRGPGRFRQSLPQSSCPIPTKDPPRGPNGSGFFSPTHGQRQRQKHSKKQTTKQKQRGRLIAYSEQPVRLVLLDLHLSLFLLLLIILLHLSALRGLPVPLGLLLRGLHLPVCQPRQNCSRVFCLKAD